jgi:ABC-type phosphate transport system auxiliary subunit
MGKNMIELARTAITIALIAIFVVLLLMAPKGFELAPPDPVISSSASGLPSGDADVFARSPSAGTVVG